MDFSEIKEKYKKLDDVEFFIYIKLLFDGPLTWSEIIYKGRFFETANCIMGLAKLQEYGIARYERSNDKYMLVETVG